MNKHNIGNKTLREDIIQKESYRSIYNMHRLQKPKRTLESNDTYEKTEYCEQMEIKK